PGRQVEAVAPGIHQRDQGVGDGRNGEGQAPERDLDAALPGQVAAPGFLGPPGRGGFVHPRIVGGAPGLASRFVPAGPPLVTARPRFAPFRVPAGGGRATLEAHPSDAIAMPRRHDIDALRVFAFALLILYHCAMLYVADWDFHLKSAYQGEWLQWPMIGLNRWRMPLLFMVSGIAIGLARVEGRRLRFGFARGWRLGLPLVFGMFVVVAFQAYCEGRASGHLAPGLGTFLVRYWQVRPWPEGSFTSWEYGITWNHLWYLAYLLPYTLLLSLAMPLLRGAASALAAMSRWRPLAGAVLCVAPVAWLAWVYLSLAPEYPRTHSLFGDWTVHAESLPLFLLGYLVAANGWFWDGVRRARWPTLALAVLGITV